MRIRIDRASDTPLYRQIVTQVQGQVASGRLQPGARLPSVRNLAVEIRINPNTVARAYRELESAGVLETQGPQGTFVAAGQAAQTLRFREADYRSRLVEAITLAESMGIAEGRAREIFEEVLSTALKDGGASDGGRRRAVG
jgi:GntR family transcriptional regulator